MRTAFKEWAAICRALAAGRQDVILRKGGIVEPGGGEFRVEHREFLLMPTFVHQAPESLVPGARDLLDGIDDDRPPEGTVVFRHRATVRASHRVRSLADLEAFRGRHVWSDAVVAERFHRWTDGIHVLVVDVAALPASVTVPWHDTYGGCRSWVELQDDVAAT
jgi:hypothetical protein